MGRKVYCYLTPQRLEKTQRIVGAFARGCNGTIIDDGVIREDGPAVIWGQAFGSDLMIKRCVELGLDYYQIDNGYFGAARGRRQGYYRITKNNVIKNWMDEGCSSDRFSETGVQLMPWKRDGGVILICAPGENFCRFFGINLERWIDTTQDQVRKYTDKKIMIRNKTFIPPLQEVLRDVGIYAVVTHSSNAAVDAIVEGVPVVCDNMCAAAPIARTSLADIENLRYDDRTGWVRSLAYGQFTMEEMESGIAWRILRDSYGG